MKNYVITFKNDGPPKWWKPKTWRTKRRERFVRHRMIKIAECMNKLLPTGDEVVRIVFKHD